GPSQGPQMFHLWSSSSSVELNKKKKKKQKTICPFQDKNLKPFCSSSEDENTNVSLAGEKSK
ncbi:unnamed protein product, partial [Heterotrigona itama]